MLLALNGITSVPDERRVAVTAIFAGSLQCVWFAPLCIDHGARIGLYLSLAASVGLVIAGALWASELPSPPPDPDKPIPPPRARLL